MRKKLNYLAICMICSLFMCNLFAQVGIGNSTPRGALDINKPTTYNMGLVLPTNSSPNNLINPQGGALAEGTLMYDNVKKCARVYNGTAWSDCLCDQCGGGTPTPTVVADCTKNGFTGDYVSNWTTSGNTFTVTVTNNSFYTATIAFQASDLVLSGAPAAGLTVASVAPTTATLTAGQSQVVTYTINGTPSATGSLTGTWSKLSLTCSNTVNVIPSQTKVTTTSPTSTGFTNPSFVMPLSELTIPVNPGQKLVAVYTINTTTTNNAFAAGFAFPAITDATAVPSSLFSLTGSYTNNNGNNAAMRTGTLNNGANRDTNPAGNPNRGQDLTTSLLKQTMSITINYVNNGASTVNFPFAITQDINYVGAPTITAPAGSSVTFYTIP